MKYADVIVGISIEQLDRPFVYRVPDELEGQICAGSKVRIPFGNGRRMVDGYVIELKDTCDYPDERVKNIDSVLIRQDDTDSRLLELADFIKKQYGSTMITALRTVLPIKKTYRKRKTKDTPDSTNDWSEAPAITLNSEQQAALDTFIKDIESGESNTYLLYGITGSGKTEVYIEMTKHVVDKGCQAIILIPEIALTYQTVERFKRYFGERVAIMNSTLSNGTRYEYCEKARNGEIDVIIGPRSALFTPFSKLGLIVIDEEHESSYKSESVPKYHARDVALELSRMHGASVVLGSATPLVESYYHACSGDYKLLTLTERATEASLPEVEIIDLREELREGNRSIFSRRLKELIKDRLDKKQQIMLFINRRGYAGFVSCRACGYVVKCDHCDVSMSEHRMLGKMVCHYCGAEREIPKMCPKCGSKYILGFKAGTEQIESELHRLFPGVRTLRMDGDTTTTKGSYEKILSSFRRREADVLVGTQMIVKGHDYPLVTLVGIIAADLSLSIGDFRAGERTFDLLTQAAGRAGRGDASGQVVVQTYQPDHYSIVHAAAQDYEAFYEEEIEYRSLLGYPPCNHIMAVLIAGKNQKNTQLLAEHLRRQAELSLADDLVMTSDKAKEKDRSARIIGPGKAGIGKINDYYRYTMYVKSVHLHELVKVKDQLEQWLADRNSDINVYFDMDPMSAY